MGIDVDKLRKMLEESKSGGGDNSGRKVNYFSLTNGENKVRILPGIGKEEFDFFQETREHWVYPKGSNKKRRIVCRTVDGHKDCPICKIHFQLKDAGEDKKAGAYRYNKRWYFNVLDLDNPDKGVLMMGAPWTVYNAIMSTILDPDYGDITDPEKGHDLKIERIDKNGKTEYTVRARPKPTPIQFNKEDLYDLSLMAKPRSVEDMEAILRGENPWENKQQEKRDEGYQNRRNESSGEEEQEDKIDFPFDVGSSDNGAEDMGDDDGLLADIMNSVKRK